MKICSHPAGAVALGVDVGGTFTDLAAAFEDGSISTSKVLSVPDDRASGVIRAVGNAGVDANDVTGIAHGTTVVTNLLLERSGARVVACATEGFTDLLELRRQERAALYDLSRHHPTPLVSRSDVIGVRERMAPDSVVTALDHAGTADAVEMALSRDPEMIAITLLHSYSAPMHEQRLAEALKEEIARRGLSIGVVCSHEVLPEIREYERMSTTVAEAYARPAVAQYLSSLTERLCTQGFPSPKMMTSAGGTLPASAAANQAATLALSGPAGGVSGAAVVLRALGMDRALTIDIGGTSADVGLIDEGEPLVERGGEVAGVPIALPRVLVEAVAAGGGSIAWVDDGHALRVGPQSAGAVPGPASYGRGGMRPTVTDAHVVAGSIAEGVWSDSVQISRERAVAVLDGLASELGVSAERAAEAVIDTANATMARALRRISVERGIDPRGLPLIAFGGGGPLHACGLAEQLDMRSIIVPPHAGVLSAVGLALAPERRELLTSVMLTEHQWTDAAMRELLESTSRTLERLTPHSEVKWTVRVRFAGQGHELEVPLKSSDSVGQVARRFVERHVERTGFSLEREIEFVSLRTTSTGQARAVSWNTADALKRARPGEPGLPAEVAAPSSVVGPDVVRLADATMLVAAGWKADLLPTGGWMMRRISQ